LSWYACPLYGLDSWQISPHTLPALIGIINLSSTVPSIARAIEAVVKISLPLDVDIIELSDLSALLPICAPMF
jgi:hypothetical protein